MNTVRFYIAFALLVTPLFGWSSEVYQFGGKTMGTTYLVKLGQVGPEQKGKISALAAKVDKLLKDVNQAVSTYIPTSEISLFNQSDRGSQASPLLLAITSQAFSIFRTSQGYFDPTIGPIVDLWGFGPKGRVDRAPEPGKLQQMMSLVAMDKVVADPKQGMLRKNHPQIRLDFSANAKGYAVDMLSDLALSEGFPHHLIEIGGELRARGMKSPDAKGWVVAIEAPNDGPGRRIERTLTLVDQAIATSGSYRNYFEGKDGTRYSHIINPRTGEPIRHRTASVSVITKACADADAWATALLAAGWTKGRVLAKTHKIRALFLVKSPKGFEGFWSGPQVSH